MPLTVKTKINKNSSTSGKQMVPEAESNITNNNVPSPIKSIFWLKKLVISLVIVIVLLAMGISYLFFLQLYTVAINGTVVDSTQFPISNASVRSGNQVALTDSQGVFRLTNIKPGSTNIRIEAENLPPFEQKIDVPLYGEINRKFVFTQQALATIKGSIVLPDNIPLPTDLTIHIDDKRAPLNDKLEFEFINIEPGSKTLVIDSSQTKRESIALDIQNRQNILNPITLTSAKDIFIKTLNWVGGEPTRAKVSVLGTSYTTSESGELVIKDVTGPNPIQLSINQQGYKDSIIDVPFDQKSITVEMVPVGRFVYTSDRAGTSAIYVSDLDGTQSKQLTSNTENTYNLSLTTTNNVLYESDRDKIKNQYGAIVPQLYYQPMEGGKVVRVSSVKGSFYDPNTSVSQSETVFSEGQKIFKSVFAQGPSDRGNYVSVRDINDANERILFEGKSVNTTDSYSLGQYILSRTGKTAAFVVNYYNSDKITQRLIMANTEGAAKSIDIPLSLDTAITTLGVSPDDQYVYYVTSKDNIQTLSVYSFKDSKLVRNTNNLSVVGSGARFDYSNPAYMYFLSNKDTTTDIYRLDGSTGEIVQLTTGGKINNFYVDKNGYLYFQKENKLYIQVPEPGKTPRETGIKTNFAMWQLMYGVQLGF